MSTNEKSLPVEMTHTENLLLKAAAHTVMAMLEGNADAAVAGARCFAELHEQIGDERGRAFFDRMTEHAKATKSTDDTETPTPPETLSTTTSPDPVTDEKPVFLNEREAVMIGAGLAFTSSFFYGDMEEGALAIEAYQTAAQLLGLDGQEALEKKFTAAFNLFESKED